MKIAVCMKQVPACSDGNMDERTGLMVRSGLETVVNSYDLAALETALQMKELTGAAVSVFTMGPKNARHLLQEAYSIGADEGYLICDRAFAGADVLATSYTLMQAIKAVGDFELILCGKQTTDGDTAQVGGALAKWFSIPHINWVTELVEGNLENITVRYLSNAGVVKAKISYPCLLAVEKDIFVPRLPSLKLKMASRKKRVREITIQDLEDQDELHYGLKGSPTRVVKIFPPARTQHQEVKVLEGSGAAGYIADILKKISDETGGGK